MAEQSYSIHYWSLAESQLCYFNRKVILLLLGWGKDYIFTPFLHFFVPHTVVRQILVRVCAYIYTHLKNPHNFHDNLK